MKISWGFRLGTLALAVCATAASCGSNQDSRDSAASGDAQVVARGGGGARTGGVTGSGGGIATGGATVGTGGASGTGGTLPGTGDASVARTGGIGNDRPDAMGTSLDLASATGGSTVLGTGGTRPPLDTGVVVVDAGARDGGLDAPVDVTAVMDAVVDRVATALDTAATIPDRPWPSCGDASVSVDGNRPSVAFVAEGTPVNIWDGTTPSSTGTIPPVYSFPGIAVLSHTPFFAGCADQVVRLDSPGEFSLVSLDGDARPDFAVRRVPESLAVTNSISFYAQGTLGTVRKVGSIVLLRGDYIDTFAVSDVNGDGLGDVVLAHHLGMFSDQSELAVYFQRADGFPAQPDLKLPPVLQGSSVCTLVQAIEAHDLDGDGRRDLVVLTKNKQVYPADDCPRPGARILVLRQGATGGFTVAQSLSPPTTVPSYELQIHHVAIGDVDGDSRPDLAVQTVGSASTTSGAKGWDTLIYRQSSTGFPEQPSQVLTLPQYLTKVRLADVNDDGRLDVLVRPGKVDDPGIATAITYGKASLSGVFLGTAGGEFGAAQSVQVSLSVPYATSSKQPFGVDIRDVDKDGARDLAVNRYNLSESIFFRHKGAYGTTSNVEASTILRDLVAQSEQVISVDLDPTPEDSSIGLSGRLNQLAYHLADVDLDGREDVVAAFQPFAPNATKNPQTGTYGPSSMFEPNSYTDVYLHLQRAPQRRISVEFSNIRVDATDQTLRFRLSLSNLAATRAEQVRVRFQARKMSTAYRLDPAVLLANFDTYADEMRDLIHSQETKIAGTVLGRDILIPGVDAGATLHVDVETKVGMVNDLIGYALYAVVDPDSTNNVLYKTVYDFIR